jgi:hypothetical protein
MASDFNHDCVVNLVDFAHTAQNWMVDCQANPSDPACMPM